MTTYLLNTILCSTLFAMVYKVLFEKEKMPRFNRFYLLSSLGLSMLIPLLTLKHEVQVLPALENVTTSFLITSQSVIPEQTVTSDKTNIIQLLLLSIYVFISFILLIRFIRNLISVLRTVSNDSTVPYHNSKIILIDQKVTPHSFLNYIFINREEYINGEVEDEILVHEMAHVQQRHSLDILFVESLQIVFWFNPILYIYRKALLLNHEFLADEAVIRGQTDVSVYQLLLLEKAGLQTSPMITNMFNYSITKKRLLMMTKRNSFRMALCKQLVVVPVLGIALFLFSAKTIAQGSMNLASNGKTTVQPTQKPLVISGNGKTTVQSTLNGISKEQMLEYKALAKKIEVDVKTPASNKLSDSKRQTKPIQTFTLISSNELSDSERERLITLYLSMSKEQQESQRVVLIPVPAPLPKIIPTKQQFESWKDANKYGVWINGKKVKNALLSSYTNTDFASVHVSKLAKNARKNVKYLYQVDLMTTENYAEYLKENSNNKGKYMLFTR